MENTKKMGIWMDYMSAHLIEFLPLRVDAIVIKSNISNPAKKRKAIVNEELEYIKERELIDIFYKKIANEILKYGKVILFGPTKAKTELMDMLETDQKFEGIKIETEDSEKMNENHKHAFVKNYFSQKIS
ncbi:hypothetical protein EGI22_12210 [Lacihabitans sp. LS3-19]|uniref:hypothetical protein n=1 Tax=Lacihabitans sp. LS3-19 TaxID=2487335 RepID=UPI0020CE14E0|nr:hypothetical protein [Lacihabitans sp. LS3-19]MCP9768681.1 hypothetical protein [Lacihabitans sp. LS3-19]